MDRKTKLYCLKTALRIFINTTERLEKEETDWEVGCRCNTEEAQCMIGHILANTLNDLALPCRVEKKLVDEKFVVAVVSVPELSTSNTIPEADKEESDSVGDSAVEQQGCHVPVVSSALDESEIVKQAKRDEYLANKKVLEDEIALAKLSLRV